MDTTNTAPIDTSTPPPTPKSDVLGRALTSREVEVLRELAGGRTNEQSAQALNISIKTVEAHRARLFKKLGASNAPQAIVFAYAQGMLKAPLTAYTVEDLTAELARRQTPAAS